MLANDCSPLVEITRGETVESIHYGAFIVVDPHGRVVASHGNPDLISFPRSSMKPFQALPFIERGGAEAFGFTDQEIAIMCASHSGTDAHRQVLAGMHEKIGTQESDLSCGVHWPSDAETCTAMKNCRGSPHPSIIIVLKTYRYVGTCPLTGFRSQGLFESVPSYPGEHSGNLWRNEGTPPEDLSLGIDGCSAPVYAFPLKNMAWGSGKTG